jgi:arylformamidase
MHVFRNYDQAQLDAQYNNRAAVPDFARWTERWPVESAAIRTRLKGRIDVPYGSGERQTLDIFPAAGSRNPVLIYIHGGFWRALSKSDFSFVAEPYVAKGIAVAMVGYPLTPTVTLDELVESVRQAVTWTCRNAASFGGDPARIHVTGHSAGGHLTAMMMSTDWAARGMPADLVKSGCAISGIYELEPIRLCYLNADVRLTEAMVPRNSPVELIPERANPLILTVGGQETDEFLRQQEVYAEAWHGAGLPLEIVPMPKAQHFSILDGFTDPDNPLFQAVVRQIFRA